MEYDKKQLIMDAFSGKPMPRVPIGFWHHFVFGADHFKGLGNKPMQDYIVEGHGKYYKNANPDLMKMMNEGFMCYPPVMGTIETREDLLAIRSVGPDHPWITEQISHVKRIIDSYGGEVMSFYNVFSPVQNLRLPYDFLYNRPEHFIELAEKYPEEFRAACMEMQKDYVTLVDRLFEETPLDGIYYCVQNIQSEKFTPELYREYIRPAEIEVLEAANRHSKYNILHICGYEHHKNNLACYQDYEAGCYNWAVHTEEISIAEGRKFFPGKCVLGGFDNNPGTLIHKGSKEELEAYVKKLVDENGFTGFIMGADCSLPNDIEDSQIRIISDAVRKYANPDYQG